MVTCLAQYLTCREIKEAWPLYYEDDPPGLTSIQHYDPRYFPHPAQKWLDLFAVERKLFNEELAAQPMESQAFRQRERLAAFRLAKAAADLPMVREILDSGAKEAAHGFGKRLDVQLQTLGPLVIGPEELEDGG